MVRVQLIVVAFLVVLFFTIALNVPRYQSMWRLIHAGSLDVPRQLSLPASPFLQTAARKGLRGDRWIVMTTINYPTATVKKLAELEDWHMVVIGDRKTPSNWSKHWQHPRCIFLDVAAQMNLKYRTVEKVPSNHYARKNIGYLFAIQHGAKLIYETDDDNEPIYDTLSALPASVEELLVFDQLDDKVVVNPYAFFGQQTLWPRGYPLEAIGEGAHDVYHLERNVKPWIQQGLANGDPDVDAIFRLTRKDKGEKIDIRFDDKAPPIGLPPGLLTPFNSQNTFFHSPAFWGLLIPIGVTFRVCDIWRGYWAQRLLWDIGGRVAFLPPSVYQDRNEHEYLLDYIDELQLYRDAGRLAQYLKAWKSDEPDMFKRVHQLTLDMAVEGFWEWSNVDLVEAWLYDLASIGYVTGNVEFTTNTRVNYSRPAVPFQPKDLPTCMLRWGSQARIAAVEAVDAKSSGQFSVEQSSSQGPSGDDMTGSGVKAAVEVIGTGNRYLLLMSAWERLANAVVATTQVMTFAEQAGLSLVEPFVFEAQIGCNRAPGSGMSMEEWSFYFDTTKLRNVHPRLTKYTDFAREKLVFLNGKTYVHINLLIFIDYFPGISPCPPNVPVPSGMVTLANGQLSWGELLFDNFTCIPGSANLSVVLADMYKDLGEQDPAIALHEYHKCWQDCPATLFDGFETFTISNHLAAEVEDFKRDKGITDKYLAVHLRGGTFFRGKSNMTQEGRMDLLKACASNMLRVSHSLMLSKNYSRLYFASDIFGSVPEYAGEYEKMRNDAYAWIGELFQANFTSALITSAMVTLPSRVKDPIGVGTLADVKLCGEADTLVVKSDSTYGWWLKRNYVQKHKDKYIDVECEYPPQVFEF